MVGCSPPCSPWRCKPFTFHRTVLLWRDPALAQALPLTAPASPAIFYCRVGAVMFLSWQVCR